MSIRQLFFLMLILLSAASCTFEPPDPADNQEIRISPLGYTLDEQSYATADELVRNLNAEKHRIKALAHPCSKTDKVVAVMNALTSAGYDHVAIHEYGSADDPECSQLP